MAGFIDLHSHWVAGVDDGAPSVEHGVALLAALRSIGFDTVVATPHMRPGMFNTDRESLETAYAAMGDAIAAAPGMPKVMLSAEHYFDEIVFARLMNGEALPYPGGKSVLVEFSSNQFPARLNDRMFDLQRKGLRPVIAHPERYLPVWKHPESMVELVERGNVLLLDVGALVGKYGRAPRKAAEELIELGLYYAACSDAHRVSDVDAVLAGITALRELVGEEEAQFLLHDGPQAILEGKVDL